MSFINNDDLSLNNILKNINFKYSNLGSISGNKEDISKLPINFMEPDKAYVSGGLSQRVSNIKTAMEGIQVGKNLLAITDESLSKIGSYLDGIKSDLEQIAEYKLSEEELSRVKDSIKENLASIDDVAKNTKFNDVKPLDGSAKDKITVDAELDGKINISSEFKDTSLKSLGLDKPEELSLKTEEDIKAFQERINNASKEINERQKRLLETEEKIDEKFNELVVTNDTLSGIAHMDTAAEKLKSAVINGIFENPYKLKKVHIEQLDEKIILGLLRVI